MTNTILKNKYRIIKLLGSGSRGFSYLGQLVDSPDKKVIIKVLLDKKDKKEENLFKKISLEQTGIPKLLDSLSVDQNYYQVFEYIPEAISLRQLIDEEAPLDEKKAIALSLELSKILKYLHLFGIVHGDIKPSNILITADQHVKLVDLGIASLNGAKRSINIGTEKYSAPEQYHGIVNFKNDIYSLGVVFYEMLTARRSKGRFSFMPIQMVNQKVSTSIIDLIQKCLEMDQAKRPSTDEVYNTLLKLSSDRIN